MRIALSVTLIVTLFCLATPISNIPELAEIWEENRYVFPLVFDTPESLLPDGCDNLAIAGVPTGELAMNLYLLGTGIEKVVVIASGPYQGEYNFAKSSASWDSENSLLVIYFQMPFCARYAGVKYSLDGDQLVPVEWLAGDPSADALDNVDSLLAIGEIREAGEELSEMFYPGAYYNDYHMTARFLESTHDHALEVYGNGNSEEAVQVYDELNDAFYYLVMPDPWYRAFESSSRYSESHLSEFMTLGAFTAIANDYGFFLEQTGRYDEAVDVLYAVLTLDPNRMVAYLNLGDALWGLQEYHSAVEEYQVYQEMMEAQNLEDQIPPRVHQRVLNYLGPM